MTKVSKEGQRMYAMVGRLQAFQYNDHSQCVPVQIPSLHHIAQLTHSAQVEMKPHNIPNLHVRNRVDANPKLTYKDGNIICNNHDMLMS